MKQNKFTSWVTKEGREHKRMNNGRNNKRQRLEEEEPGQKEDSQPDAGARLSEELRGLLGGRKYVKAKDL